MDCREWEERITALVDDELGVEERASVEAHLASCPTCRAAMEAEQGLAADLRALPRPSLPHDFRAGVMNSLPPAGAAAGPASGGGRILPMATWIAAAAAAAAAITAMVLVPSETPLHRKSAEVAMQPGTTTASEDAHRSEGGDSGTPMPASDLDRFQETASAEEKSARSASAEEPLGRPSTGRQDSTFSEGAKEAKLADAGVVQVEGVEVEGEPSGNSSRERAKRSALKEEPSKSPQRETAKTGAPAPGRAPGSTVDGDVDGGEADRSLDAKDAPAAGGPQTRAGGEGAKKGPGEFADESGPGGVESRSGEALRDRLRTGSDDTSDGASVFDGRIVPTVALHVESGQPGPQYREAMREVDAILSSQKGLVRQRVWTTDSEIRSLSAGRRRAAAVEEPVADKRVAPEETTGLVGADRPEAERGENDDAPRDGLTAGASAATPSASSGEGPLEDAPVMVLRIRAADLPRLRAALARSRDLTETHAAVLFAGTASVVPNPAVRKGQGDEDPASAPAPAAPSSPPDGDARDGEMGAGGGRSARAPGQPVPPAMPTPEQVRRLAAGGAPLPPDTLQLDTTAEEIEVRIRLSRGSR